jgi:hypothetical protein
MIRGSKSAENSNAILWTHFVTPRGDQTQQDQTEQVSYYKRGEAEGLGSLGHTTSSLTSSLALILLIGTGS